MSSSCRPYTCIFPRGVVVPRLSMARFSVLGMVLACVLVLVGQSNVGRLIAMVHLLSLANIKVGPFTRPYIPHPHPRPLQSPRLTSSRHVCRPKISRARRRGPCVHVAVISGYCTFSSCPCWPYRHVVLTSTLLPRALSHQPCPLPYGQI